MADSMHHAIWRAHFNSFFSLLALVISCVLILKKGQISQTWLYFWLTGNSTSCRPVRSVIILVIKQIGLPLRGQPILLITSIITDRIGLPSVLITIIYIFINTKTSYRHCLSSTEQTKATDLADASFLMKVLRSKLVKTKNEVEVQRNDPSSPLHSVKSFEELPL